PCRARPARRPAAAAAVAAASRGAAKAAREAEVGAALAAARVERPAPAAWAWEWVLAPAAAGTMGRGEWTRGPRQSAGKQVQFSHRQTLAGTDVGTYPPWPSTLLTFASALPAE